MSFSSFPSGSKGSRGNRISPKQPEKHRINERIRVPEVRLIDHEGRQVGVVPTRQALQMARDVGLDLMEVAPNAKPPVCKICDYGKFKYEQKKKEHEAKKKQTVIKVKEIQLRPGTETHDLEYKFRNARRFLEDGDKVKVTVMYRGRQIVHPEQGFKILEQLAEQVTDIAIMEQRPKMEGRKLIMILAPAAQGAGGKKAPAPKPIVIANKVSVSNTSSGSSATATVSASSSSSRNEE